MPVHRLAYMVKVSVLLRFRAMGWWPYLFSGIVRPLLTTTILAGVIAEVASSETAATAGAAVGALLWFVVSVETQTTVAEQFLGTWRLPALADASYEVTVARSLALVFLSLPVATAALLVGVSLGNTEVSLGVVAALALCVGGAAAVAITCGAGTMLTDQHWLIAGIACTVVYLFGGVLYEPSSQVIRLAGSILPCTWAIRAIRSGELSMAYAEVGVDMLWLMVSTLIAKWAGQSRRRSWL
jgi:hypothetical protein